MKFQFSVVVFCVSIFLFNSCKDSITDPLNKPGSRNYTWTIDTIKTGTEGYVFFMRMWGSSPTDIWAVGESDVGSNTTWHYDGKTWYNIKKRMSSGYALFGFGKNDVWRSNNNNEMWYYDGVDWNNVIKFSDSEYSHLAIEDIWGSSSNDIYGVGFKEKADGDYNGFIVHFDGSKWSTINIGEKKVRFRRIRKQVKSGTYFIDGWVYDPNKEDEYTAYTFDGANLNEIYSSNSELTYTGWCNDEVYIVINRKIYKYENHEMKLWKDFSGYDMLGGIFLRNENDFFCMSQRGIGHYNGADYKVLLEFNFLITGAQIFEKDVFFIAVDPNTNTNVLIHGKLNN